MSFLSQIKVLARETAWHTGISRALARSQRAIRVLMIHGVGDADCTAQAFREQLHYLQQNFEIIPLEEAVRRIGARAAKCDREVVLTFDDGLRNTLQLAYPVLKDLGLPATVFVCPGLIGQDLWLWNHECRARLRSLDAAERTRVASRAGAPTADANPFIEWMKTLPLARRRETEAIVHEASSRFTPSAAQKQMYDIMTWRELESLDQDLVTIGAHTVTHPILTTLSPDELDQEIHTSRTKLEERLRRPVRFFCYPNGSHDENVVRVAASYFDAAVTTEAGVASAETSLHRIPRLPVAESVSKLAWRLHRHDS